MKKRALFVVLAVILLVLPIAIYSFVWGGKPYIENFDQVSDQYEIVAKFALDSYNKLGDSENQSIIIYFDKNNLEYNGSFLPLTDKQKNAVLTAGKKFAYLRVSQDAVFFCMDETGYYGLVYSKHPITALYKKRLPQQGRDYHRLSSRFYEWGVWGL